MTAIILPFLAMDDHPNRILELRRREGLSQERLGEIVGMSKMQISRLERGTNDLSLEAMRKIADALGVSPADLLDEHDNPMRLRPDERVLIDHYRAADENGRENIQKVTEALAPYRQRDAA